ncbi:MAG: aminotransferase class I/II-fold pyridoxal phosphate-dependent enzyme [Pseudonocardiales bacterium]|nr:aminotransferase class I/II-fold pyridoxal phosphate-dependent enzyme [Pseudonocardiales bacterium]
MVEQVINERIQAAQVALRPFLELVTQAPGRGVPVIADFFAGNPQEPTLPGFIEALRRWSVPASTDWFAYRMMHEPAREAAAASLTAELGLDFAAQDVFLTRGAMGAIGLALSAVVDPGDEVVFLSPPWFFYEAMIIRSGGTPVRVRLEPPAFDLDVSAIAALVGPRTRAVIINTPHNPTGRIYPAAALSHLAAKLTEAGRRYGRPIWVISDEAYSRIVFDGRRVPSPARFYPYSLLVHTYSKSALAPGQRLGFLALPPDLPDAEAMRRALLTVSFGTAPDAVMQYALPDIDRLLIDVAAIERRRDRMVSALRDQGYDLQAPEGTFYLLPRAPVTDDRAFCAVLASQGVLVLPGHVVELPGYFRISLTATDEMVERSLPVFARAIQRARSGELSSAPLG